MENLSNKQVFDLYRIYREAEKAYGESREDFINGEFSKEELVKFEWYLFGVQQALLALGITEEELRQKIEEV